MKIYCCCCEEDVEAGLVRGVNLYPHRPDLHNLPFWMCATCGCFVGCHHKTKNPTKPLGVIPSPEMKNARKRIHWLLDPLWQRGYISRGEIYTRVSKELGYTYHTAELRTIEECRKVWRIIRNIEKEMNIEDKTR